MCILKAFLNNIEYWGYKNTPKYEARKAEKNEIYKKCDFNLIELNDRDVQNIDDILPRLLLEYGVKFYGYLHSKVGN